MPQRSSQTNEESGPSLRAAFGHVTEWVFDLDNTLYPASIDLFSQIDARMTSWVAEYFGLERQEAFDLQKTLYQQHGTTLSGLIAQHDVDPADFFAFVHDLDYSAVTPDKALGDAIRALPGRRFIFTNGDKPHAERTARALGILDHFDDIFDIVAAGMTPKPNAATYQAFLNAHGVHPQKAAMFEDMPRNLAVPKKLGMVTVLVEPLEAPAFKQKWEARQSGEDDADFIVTELGGFLSSVVDGLQHFHG